GDNNVKVSAQLMGSGERTAIEANVLGSLLNQFTDPNSAAQQFLYTTKTFLKDFVSGVSNGVVNTVLGALNQGKQVIAVSPNPVNLSANVGQFQNPEATLTISNAGPKGSTLEYVISAHLSLSDGTQVPLSISSPNQALDGGASDQCTVTADLVGL